MFRARSAMVGARQSPAPGRCVSTVEADAIRGRTAYFD